MHSLMKCVQTVLLCMDSNEIWYTIKAIFSLFVHQIWAIQIKFKKIRVMIDQKFEQISNPKNR